MCIELYWGYETNKECEQSARWQIQASLGLQFKLLRPLKALELIFNGSWSVSLRAFLRADTNLCVAFPCFRFLCYQRLNQLQQQMAILTDLDSFKKKNNKLLKQLKRTKCREFWTYTSA